MVTKRSPEEIQENDLVHFIVTVRKLSTQATDLRRNMGLIRNLANKIFRFYIGYTPRGEYRLKAKDEQCFSQEVQAQALDDPLGGVGQENPRLAQHARETVGPESENADED